MKLNPDIAQAPENTIILLAYRPYPFFLTGQRSKDFEGGIALVLPAFQLRPDEDADKDDVSLFERYPSDWFHETTAGELELANLHININPEEYSLVVPPKSWKLVGWVGIQSIQKNNHHRADHWLNKNHKGWTLLDESESQRAVSYSATVDDDSDIDFFSFPDKARSDASGCSDPLSVLEEWSVAPVYGNRSYLEQTKFYQLLSDLKKRQHADYFEWKISFRDKSGYAFPEGKDDLEKVFNDLVSKVIRETRYTSSTDKIAMHPAYQQIIGLGEPAVPFLLRELERRTGRWFWALKSITREDPVPDSSKGRTQEMISAWLEWGRKRGYRWQ